MSEPVCLFETPPPTRSFSKNKKSLFEIESDLMVMMIQNSTITAQAQGHKCITRSVGQRKRTVTCHFTALHCTHFTSRILDISKCRDLDDLRHAKSSQTLPQQQQQPPRMIMARPATSTSTSTAITMQHPIPMNRE